MMLFRMLKICLFGGCLGVLLLPQVGYGRALKGDASLLEPMGTTPVAETQEKIIFAYVIRPGDTLWDIAKWVLKDPFQWPELLKYNYIENPDLIYPGDRLIVPSTEILEKVKQARDIQEIEKIRAESLLGAKVQELTPGQKHYPATSQFGESRELLLVPRVEAEVNSGNGSELKISGRKNLEFRYREYRGGLAPNYFSSGYTRSESLALSLTGQIQKKVKVEGEFYQSDQNLENKYMLKLSTENLELLLGDFDASLPDTEYIIKNHTLSGGRLTADFKQLGGNILVGAPKGAAQYERFFGNRTQGPFYLKQTPVVFDSEKIMLNKQLLQRGSDYQLDYISGQIMFLKQAVDDITLVEVIYEARQTIFPRSLYAGRFWGKPVEWIRVGGSLAREEDPEGMGVVAIGLGNTVTPIGHWVVGTDLAAEVPGFGTLAGEWARSRFQANRLVVDASEGQAVKGELNGSIGPLGLTGYYKQTTPDFRSIGSQEQGSDLTNYGGKADLKTGAPFSIGGGYDVKDSLINQIREKTRQLNGLARLFPTQWPAVGYEYFQLSVQNDAVGLLHQDHQTTRHSGTVAIGQDNFELGARAEQERRAGELSDRSSATSRNLEITAAAKNLKWLALNGLYQHQWVAAEGTSLSAGRDYQASKAKVNGFFTPSDRYLFSLNNEWVWDPVNQNSYTLDTKMNATPINEIRVDGKYTLETLQSLLISSYQRVFSQTASGQVEWNPWPVLSLRVAPSLRWTIIADTGALLNKNQIDQGDIRWNMLPEIAHEVQVQRDVYVLSDSTDPGLRTQTEQEKKKGSYALNLAVSNAVTGRGNASIEQYGKNQWNYSRNDYDHLQGQNREFGINFKSSLQERLRSETGYTLALRDQAGTSAESVTRTAYPISDSGQSANQYALLNSFGSVHTREDTANEKITVQWNEGFSTYLEGIYDRNEDLTGIQSLIQTASPGLGLIWRWGLFRLEANAKLAKSWGALQTHQENYTANLTYNPWAMISLALRGQHSRTYAPDSLSTEAGLTCSIQF